MRPLPRRGWIPRKLGPQSSTTVSSILWAAWVFLCGYTLHGISLSARAETPAPESIPRLIEELGASEFQAREAAEKRLREMGLEIYETLLTAQQHEDIEIRLRVAAILRHLRGQHLLHQVDPLLRRLVRQYQGANRESRARVIESLAHLAPQQGVEVLVRIARLEPDEELSQRAALLLLQRRFPSSADRLRQIHQAIGNNLGPGGRLAVDWLDLLAKSLTEPEQAARSWPDAIQRYVDAKGQAPSAPVEDVLLVLRRAWLDSSIRATSWEQAQQIARDLSPQIARDSLQVTEWLAWLVDRKLYESVLDFHRQRPEVFRNEPRHLYLLAIAQTGLDQQAQAQVSCDQAHQALENPQSRLDVGEWLENSQGQYAWAEREYRRVLEDEPPTSVLHQLARFNLGTMLHDLQRDLEAAQLGEEALLAAEKSPEIRVVLEQLHRNFGDAGARVHLYYALHFRRKDDPQKEREHLEKGFDCSSTEIDLLIARYRCRHADDTFRSATLAAIKQACEQYEQDILTYQTLKEPPLVNPITESLRPLANTLNEYAWLVSNTEGNVQRAIQFSRRSLMIDPGNEAYLDTLGRCYYASGDLDRAIEYQSMAVERAPHEQQIARQLKLFQRARARRAGEEPKPKS